MIRTPDIDFINKLSKESCSSLKSCMQCGTCSVVCRLSPGVAPFPRKEMMLVSWGLKDKALTSPRLWLCHQCGECSDHCPRNVRPSDVLASLRKTVYHRYARPGFMGALMGKSVFLPVALAIPAIIILSVLFFAGTGDFTVSKVNYSGFFPHLYLNIFFTALVLFTIAGNLAGIIRFWKDMKLYYPAEKQTTILTAAFSVFKDILRHKRFADCESGKSKSIAHMMIFWGFFALLFVTLIAIVNVVFFEYPMGPWHPAKIAGNLAGVMLITGCFIMIFKRIRKNAGYSNSSYFDWSFIIGLLLLGFSGGLTEIARYGNWSTAYYIYFFHLVMVWFVVLYAPFSKFAHIIYRTMAMIYSQTTACIK